MITIPIQKTLGTMLFDSAYPRNDFNSGEQRKNADGVPMWSMNIILRQPDARRSETLTVSVPSPVDPSTKLDPFAPIGFEGLRIMTGEGNDGHTWVSFAADKFGLVSPKTEK